MTVLLQPPVPTTATVAGRPVRWALLALLASLPVIFALATWDPGLGNDRLRGARSFATPVLLAEVLSVLLAVASGWNVRGALANLNGPQRILLTVLVGVATFTATWVAPDRLTAIGRSGCSLVHIAFGFALTHLLARWDIQLRGLLWPAITVGVIGYVVLLPFYMIAIPARTGSEWGEFGLAVVNIRQVGFYALVGSAAALGLAVVASGSRIFYGWVGVATLCVGLSAWSGTRSSIVALIAAVGLTTALVPSLRTWRTATSTAIGTLGGVLASMPFPVPSPLFGVWRMSGTLAPDQDVSSGRIEMWLNTINRIGERPLLGFGESQFRGLVLLDGVAYNHPHNVVLQIAFQWGLVGLTCIAALAWPLMRRAVRNARAAPVPAAPALLVLMSLLVMSLFEGTMYHTYPIAIVALSLAYLLTLASPNADRHRKL